MSGRGTSNSPNTRYPDRPASKPARLDQFAGDVSPRLVKLEEDMGVTSRKEKKTL
ncbi:hypothetical protein [Desulforamulus aeronauticus]|uniref:Uncharacterized protein n=1 Tax=Desulforamulus aeronauticus DSM 10349 TaxID=1121421 RepID=A0A1M6QSJ3_9FIRM|nr:hypothetical protein [Desulforamulus aeronauticus]SHK23221.1 hypothetical protein SAMN02745123_01178 [Desulforamulus aeronauticus DSM 10349]